MMSYIPFAFNSSKSLVCDFRDNIISVHYNDKLEIDPPWELTCPTYFSAGLWPC